MISRHYLLTLPLLLILGTFAPAASTADVTTVIRVDGQTGEVLSTVPTDRRVFYPGEVVTVEIVRANLLNYSYAIKLETTAIQRLYYVSGIAGGVLTDLAVPPPKSPGFTTEAIENGLCPDVLNDETHLAHINSLKSGFEKAAKATTALYGIRSNPSLNFKDEVTWDTQPVENALTQVSDAEALIASERAYFVSILDRLPYIADTSGCVNVLKRVARRFVETSDGALTTLASHRNILREWLHIMRTNQPVVKQTLRIDDVAKRYTVSIVRTQIPTAPAAVPAAAPAAPSAATIVETSMVTKTTTGSAVTTSSPKPASTGSAKEQEDVITVLTLEGHTKSRFVFSAGFAGFDGDRRISFTPTVRHSAVATNVYNENDELVRTDISYVDSTFYSAHTRKERFIVAPILMMGYYLSGGVDELDPEGTASAWYDRFFIFGGLKFEIPIERVFLGINYDFSSGITVGGGATWGHEESLVGTWTTATTEITEGARTKIGQPPVNTDTPIIPFINFSFRPVFLSTLYKWLGGIAK